MGAGPSSSQNLSNERLGTHGEVHSEEKKVGQARGERGVLQTNDIITKKVRWEKEASNG